MRHFVAMLVALPILALPARAQQPADLDKIVPEDAFVRVVADGIDPVKAAVIDLLNAIMPGMGGAMAEQGFQSFLLQPGMSEVDTTKPITLTLLSNEAVLFGMPVKDSAKFETGIKSDGNSDIKSVISEGGYSLVVLAQEAKLDEIRKAPSAKGPSLQGPVRGFVNVKGLYAKHKAQLDSMLSMMSAMAAQAGGQTVDMNEMVKGFAEDVPRLDFALIPSKSGLEIAVACTPSPTAKGLIAAIAKGQASSVSDKYLSVIPADCAMAFSGRFTTDMASAYSELLGMTIASKGRSVSAEDKAQFSSLMARMLASGTGDFAGGLCPAADSSGLSFVGAMSCSDKDKERATLKDMVKEVSQPNGWWQKMLTSMYGVGTTFSCDFKPAAETIDGAEIDQMIFKFALKGDTDASSKVAAEMVAKIYAEPFRFAYLPGVKVMAGGVGGADRMKAALASVKSQAALSAVAKSLPSGTSFSAAVNLTSYLKLVAGMMPAETAGPLAMFKNLPPSKDYLTFTFAPKNGAAEMRMNVPAAAIQSIVMGVQGMGGGGPR